MADKNLKLSENSHFLYYKIIKQQVIVDIKNEIIWWLASWVYFILSIFH